MAHPVPTKAFLQPSPEAAMLFAPFGYTHPPHPVPPSPTISAHAEPISKKTLREVTSQAQNLLTSIESLVVKGLT